VIVGVSVTVDMAASSFSRSRSDYPTGS